MKSKVILSNRTPDVMDRFLLYYIEDRKLSPKQEEKRKQYETAHALRVNCMSREQTVKMLVSRKIASSIREAYRIVSRSEQLFGDLNIVNKNGLRHLLTENLSRVLNAALASGQLKEANKSQELIAKINGVITDNSNVVDMSLLIIPVPVYTSDVKVLKEQETQDIPHEIIEDEE